MPNEKMGPKIGSPQIPGLFSCFTHLHSQRWNLPTHDEKLLDRAQRLGSMLMGCRGWHAHRPIISNPLDITMILGHPDHAHHPPLYRWLTNDFPIKQLGDVNPGYIHFLGEFQGKLVPEWKNTINIGTPWSVHWGSTLPSSTYGNGRTPDWWLFSH